MALQVISPTRGLAKGNRALNIVVLSEGFLASREGVFVAQVRRFNRTLRTTSPFHRFADLVTVSALFVPSTVSIANITNLTRCAWRVPNAAGQLPADDAPSPFATPFGALYCRSRETTTARAPIPRSMWGDSTKVDAAIKAQPALTGLQVAALVLVDNSQADGGSERNDVGWFAMTSDWVDVAIHELGHSAFGLADEYDSDGPGRHDPAEPTAPNVTTRANRNALLAFWNAAPAKRSLLRWHDLMDAATPAPASAQNLTCTPLAAPERQLAKPGVTPETVGLFEGADHSPCAIFRPRLGCKMRHSVQAFCPVCEWAIGTKLSRVSNLMRVDGRATVAGAWTLLAFYHEERSRAAISTDLGRLVFYAGATGDYQIHGALLLREPTPPAISAAGVRIDALWTSLSSCEIGGLPHLLAHSLPLGRLAIFEVVDAAGKPRLDLRFDSGANAVPWTHVTTFVSGGRPHMIGYQSSTGRLEISRINVNNAAPKIVFGTALDATQLWLPGYTIITTFPVDSVPHVLKHNAVDGVVHVQSLDPPGAGPNTFISRPGHWSPGATAAIGYEADGRTFVHRMSLTNYEAVDWVWPGGAGVEMQIRRQSLDITLAVAVIRGKTAFGISPFGVHQVAAMDLMAGRVRMMSVG
ncbi:MAG: M64 family metallopeptidase [Betaproteobacteria bacterium]